LAAQSVSGDARSLRRFIQRSPGHRELAEGYALRVAQDEVSVEELHKWAGLEGKCCPFLEFGLVIEGDELWLQLTGPTGVKEFLKAEMGM
jgi:hypothetical protein